jgi:hypothetical protein
MTSPSNLYAEKIFSEHPIALWSLDDKADYVSFINEGDRVFANAAEWTTVNGISSSPSGISDEPFITSIVSRVTGAKDDTEVVCIKNEGFPISQMNQDLGTFAIGVYVFPETPLVDGFEIGYEYTDPDTLEIVQETKAFQSNVFNRWIFLSETFLIPQTTEGLRLVLKLKYEATDEVETYPFLVNGLTFGQWSENFNTSSLGVDLEDLSGKNIAIAETSGIEARAYGLQDLSGYYLAEDNKLFARNSGVPLVYGASSITALSPNPNGPSVIIPGAGFLNDVGQYKEYTFEMWIRLNSNTTENKRIFGPIASDDGLYVDGPFLTLKIGDQFGSHYVGEWFRPMLINIRVLNNSASLMLNGEEVIFLNINTALLSYPKEFNEFGESQDWLGFYAYDDISPIEIDCVALYPYAVPAIVAKRRWVYGQGVESPENINTAYSGTSVFIDYPFANYANNYSYPDIGRWGQGLQENVNVDNNTLSSPNYSLPNVVFSNNPNRDWYADCKTLQNEFKPFVNLKPGEEWANSEGHILFTSLNALTQDTKAFYGIFKYFDIPETEEVLFQLVNELTNNYLTISLIGQEVQYRLKFGVEPEQIILTTSNNYVAGTEFIVGINLKKFAEATVSNLLAFFGDKERLKLYVGGSKDFTNTFSGNIYKVGICSERNLDKISAAFSENGLVPYDDIFADFDTDVDFDAGLYNTEEWDELLDGGFYNSRNKASIDPHIASYTLVPRIMFDKLILDIAADSYWEDYLPLSYFAKFVTDVNGDTLYDLDMLQLNINYPAVTKTFELDGVEYYDTSESLIKTYISFQYLQTSNTPFKSLTRTKLLTADGIVSPDSNIFNTKYEVVDNTLIYLPPGINFNELELVMHVELQSKGIITQPIKIKKLQVASQAFNEVSPNPIGTRFGAKIFPYKRYGLYFSYKEKNPVSIYKGSTPYLYLTKNSGIQLRGGQEPGVTRGLSIPINETLATTYRIIAAQVAVLQNEGLFPEQAVEIFEIQGRTALIKFYMVSSQPDRRRARIYAVNATTGALEDGIVFYVNGNAAKNPTIAVNEWAMLGISFSQTIDFRNYQGAFRINGPLLVNNISYYQSTSLQEVQVTVSRPWLRVKSTTEDPLDRPWDYWLSSFSWNGVLVISSASFLGLDASNIYKAYTGTNKIIIDDTKVDTNTANTFRLKNYEYNILKNVLLQSSTKDAV